MAALLTQLLVRLVHVSVMALMLGGAAVVWGQVRAADAGTPLSPAVAYEWVFWGAVGTAVLTGVGNLGAMAPEIPGPGTDWGLTLAVKLGAVAALLVGSVVRTLAVVRLRASGAAVADSAGLAARLEVAYAATAGYLLVLVALAEVLAHG